jgi:hypothetical protein
LCSGENEAGFVREVSAVSARIKFQVGAYD